MSDNLFFLYFPKGCFAKLPFTLHEKKLLYFPRYFLLITKHSGKKRVDSTNIFVISKYKGYEMVISTIYKSKLICRNDIIFTFSRELIKKW